MASKPSRAVARCGTEQPDVPGRILTAGPLSVELDNGQLRYLRVNGVEALRALGFLVRDENWGTYVPTVTGLKIDQRKNGFSVAYHADCGRGDMRIGFDISIEGFPDGRLDFVGTATPSTDFLTARTGFVGLHPLDGVVGKAVDVLHTDGKLERSKFPEKVDPIQPFLNIRSLTYEVLPGVKATIRMEGDAWEMEDHRNWTDASFKTYVRPLALPWPYTLKAGEAVRQSLHFSLSGAVPATSGDGTAAALRVNVGKTLRQLLPPIGLGVPAGEIGPSIARLALVKRLAPRVLQCHFDPRKDHGLKELYGYRVLCEQTGADCVLEVIVQSQQHYAEELQGVAKLVAHAGLKPAAVAVCHVGDLKAVLPSGARPPAPPRDRLYIAARNAFHGIALGGGMFSFFTELNRLHPPADLLDFVMNTTCPIVHAADDRSVMETLEALPWQIKTARSFIGKTPHRIGPSAIGCRDNPHGAAFTPNPDNERVCLSNADPRTRGLFGAAWTLGYIATLARAGVDAITIGATTGPLGVIHRQTDGPQPWFADHPDAQVYPAYHVLTGLARSSGAKLVDTRCSDGGKVASLACKAKGGTILWLANLTAEALTLGVDGVAGRGIHGASLDEASFVQAVTDPIRWQSRWKPVDPSNIPLGAYAVAVLSIDD
ncbi:MAG: hypothetical protein KIT73_14755 [Burkholderiales bacterium]|nr:hypothetical protein [Burkholderiales bacterium]